MEINFEKFFAACDPSRTLMVENSQDSKYYINFASVRGDELIKALRRTITRISPDKPTCQLFTGHIGCGKSTELLRLKADLKQQGFHVVYFESTQDLDMTDVDVTDILLAIVRQIGLSLEEIHINLRPPYFIRLFSEIADFLNTPIELSTVNFSLPFELAKITAKAKDSPQIRNRLRECLEPQTNGILKSINDEIIKPANEELKKLDKKGLVVIIDNLDRIDPRPGPTGTPLPEYLFIDRGEQLRKLNCHLVYTIPLALVFSNEFERLRNRLGGGIAPQVLPMVPVKLRNGSECSQGMTLLKQMIMVRAFPEVNKEQLIHLITKLFEEPETLDRLCQISGGHVRNLLGLLYGCLRKEDPPLSKACLEREIREYRDNLLLGIRDNEWDLLFKVVKEQKVSGEQEYQNLLRSMFVYEYRDEKGRWFGINPVLEETENFQSWQQSNS